MTPTDFRAALARLGQTQAGAARLLGVEARSVRRYASGHRPVPEPVVRLLWACERDAGLVGALRRYRDAPPDAP
jgi:hypothetical protein